MAKIPFREFHILEILYGFQEKTVPLDSWISHYFRSHPAIGSKDRAFIAETLYGLVRWLGAVDYLAGETASWSNRLRVYLETDFSLVFANSSLPAHIRVSFPEEFFNCIAASYGHERALELCYASNFPAPTFVRVNPLKIHREELLERWKEVYSVSPTLSSPLGIIFHKKINFFTLPEFKMGLFEVQDEGSQLLAGLLEANPGELVLDYCSGSGGKTLAFAHRLAGKGQIFLHDIRRSALQEARKRLKRAGIQNAQVVFGEDVQLARLKKRCDWVLADVPCSGSGTLRRNPDLKWKFELPLLQRLCSTQRTIFEKALSFLKIGGKIVYATCSILKEENEAQVAHFLKAYPLELIDASFHSWPKQEGMDGFFAAVFQKKLEKNPLQKKNDLV